MQQARRYATESAPKSGSNAAIYAIGAGALGAAGYWYFGSGSASKAAIPAAPPKPAFTGGDQGWISLKLAEVENVNHNTKRFRFELPEGDMVSGLQIASAILTKYKGPNDAKATLRPYTPINDEGSLWLFSPLLSGDACDTDQEQLDARGYIDLLVKKYPDGPMSTHLHNMAPGQRLDVKGPLPKYPWTENKHDHIALVAGGTGITPMYQLARAIFNNPNDKTKVTLVFGNVAEDDILLKKELAELENTYPQRFRAFYTLDNPPKGWAGTSGVIDKNLLKTVLPEAKEENIKIFVCGPPGMMKAISGNKVSPKDQGELTGTLKDLGYKSEQVYKF